MSVRSSQPERRLITLGNVENDSFGAKYPVDGLGTGILKEIVNRKRGFGNALLQLFESMCDQKNFSCFGKVGNV